MHGQSATDNTNSERPMYSPIHAPIRCPAISRPIRSALESLGKSVRPSVFLGRAFRTKGCAPIKRTALGKRDCHPQHADQRATRGTGRPERAKSGSIRYLAVLPSRPRSVRLYRRYHVLTIIGLALLAVQLRLIAQPLFEPVRGVLRLAAIPIATPLSGVTSIDLARTVGPGSTAPTRDQRP
jgi:hypothetical protein